MFEGAGEGGLIERIERRRERFSGRRDDARFFGVLCQRGCEREHGPSRVDLFEALSKARRRELERQPRPRFMFEGTYAKFEFTVGPFAKGRQYPNESGTERDGRRAFFEKRSSVSK